MSHRTEIAAAAAAGLRRFAAAMPQSPVVIGFDGFVDSIIEVVDTRTSPEKYEAVHTIEQLGRKVLAAAGQSSNYELIVKLEKLGGNGPIMANAMASIGFPTTYIGSLGYPSLHHVFQPMAKIAECISFCEPGYTDALEFADGKLMFGKHGTLKDVNAEQLRKVVGDARLIDTLSRCRLLGMVNWTMLTKMDGIWKYLVTEIFPKLKPLAGGLRRMIFIDLADPEKRTREDLLSCLRQCTSFQQQADVVLGYNLKEAVQVAEVLGVKVGSKPEAEIEAMARAILDKLCVHSVVVHPRAGAAAAVNVGGRIESGSFAGPFVARPKLSTGAGDNFNAGFCLGLLAGLPVQQALCVGTATSGYYVRNAASPTIQHLADFCDNLPAPEPSAG